MDHPWRRLRDRTDWLLEWALLPPGLLGYTAHKRRAVVLDLRLTQAERVHASSVAARAGAC